MSNLLSESKDLPAHHKDDGIVVKGCITSTCYVAQTTVFTWNFKPADTRA